MHDFAQPQKATATKASISALDSKMPGRANAKFVYVSHAASWEFSTDHGWLPRLKKIELRPGVNGQKMGANGFIPALGKYRAEGFTIIDESGACKVTGPDGDIIDEAGYLNKWPGRRGPIYQDVWSIPSMMGTGAHATVDWISQYDHAGYNAWRVWLRDTGAVPPPQAAVLAQACKVQEVRANRKAREGHAGNPYVQKKVKGEMDKLEAMKEAAHKLGMKRRGKQGKRTRGPNKPKKVGLADGQ